MIKPRRNPDWFDCERDVTLTEPFRGDTSRGGQWIVDRNCETASVIFLCDPVRADLKENARYVRQRFKVTDSLLISEAKRKVKDSLDYDEFRRICKRRGISLSGNTGRIDGIYNEEYSVELQQAYLLSKALMALPEMIYDLKCEFREDMQEEQADMFQMESLWREELQGMLFPRVKTESFRVVRVPELLKSYIEGYRFAQLYFVGQNGSCDCVISTDKSLETHKRWGTIFSDAGKLGMESPTYVYRLDAQNRFRYVKTYERFKVYDLDIHGRGVFQRDGGLVP